MPNAALTSGLGPLAVTPRMVHPAPQEPGIPSKYRCTGMEVLGASGSNAHPPTLEASVVEQLTPAQSILPTGFWLGGGVGVGVPVGGGGGGVGPPVMILAV